MGVSIKILLRKFKRKIFGRSRSHNDQRNKKGRFVENWPLWEPSPRSASVIATVFILTFIFTRADTYLFIKNWMPQVVKDKVFILCNSQFEFLFIKFDETNVLMGIYAGVGASLISLAFFVAQSLSTDEPERAAVLMRRSFFFPLLTIGVLAWLLFVFKPNVLIMFPVIILAIWTATSFYRVIRVLFRPLEMAKAMEDSLLRSAKIGFLDALDQEVKERENNNKLSSKYGDDQIISSNCFQARSSDSTTLKIYPEKLGRVSNVKVDQLGALKFFLSQNLAYKKPTNVKASDGIQNQGSVELNSSEPYSNLRVSIGSIVTENSVLFEYDDSRFIETLDKEQLAFLVLNAFEVISNESVEQAKSAVNRIKVLCIDAARGKRHDELQRYLSVYPKLMGSFIEYFGAGVSSEDSVTIRRSSFSFSLAPLDWFLSDIREVFDDCLMSNDIRILRETSYLPIKLLQTSVSMNDHLFFDSFLYYPTLAYKAALHTPHLKDDKKLRSHLVDRSWRHLRELINFHLAIKKTNGLISEKEYELYAKKVLKGFQHLLKACIDYEDSETFTTIIKQLRLLFDRSRKVRGSEMSRSEGLKVKLSSNIDELFFGVGSWIFQLKKKQSKTSELSEMLNVVQEEIGESVAELTEIYLKFSDKNSESFWDWSAWEMQVKTEGEVHWVETHNHQRVYYLYQLLMLVRNMNEVQIASIRLPGEDRLSSVVDDSRNENFLSQVNEYLSSSNEFPNLDVTKAISAINEIFNNEKQRQAERHKALLRDLSISPNKVVKFSDGLSKNYDSSGSVTSALNHFGAYQNAVSTLDERADRIGVNTLFDKEPFVDNEKIMASTYVGFDNGFSYGSSLAKGESTYVVEQMVKHCKNIPNTKLEELVQKIGVTDAIIFSANSSISKYFGYRNRGHIESWAADFPKDKAVENANSAIKIDSVFVPIYEFHGVFKNPDLILVMDRRHFGRFRHLSPITRPEIQLIGVCGVAVDVFEDNSNAMTELIESPPEWLLDCGNSESQRQYLTEHVRIEAAVCFDFTIPSDFVGYQFEVTDNYEDNYQPETINALE